MKSRQIFNSLIDVIMVIFQSKTTECFADLAGEILQFLQVENGQDCGYMSPVKMAVFGHCDLEHKAVW